MRADASRCTVDRNTQSIPHFARREKSRLVAIRFSMVPLIGTPLSLFFSFFPDNSPACCAVVGPSLSPLLLLLSVPRSFQPASLRFAHHLASPHRSVLHRVPHGRIQASTRCYRDSQPSVILFVQLDPAVAYQRMGKCFLSILICTMRPPSTSP
jgi:hypothetical protein